MMPQQETREEGGVNFLELWKHAFLVPTPDPLAQHPPIPQDFLDWRCG